VKVTVIVQLVPPAIDAPQVLVCGKSVAFVPLTAIEVTETGPEPRFVTVTVLLADFPTFVEPNASVLVEMEIAVPVPDTEITCGLLGSESLIDTLAVREPDAWGAN
jgi:hypothetical protein